jgi:putative copper export protein
VSRDDLTLVSLLIHIPAVTLWVGLALFDMFAMLAPGIEDGQRARLVASTRWLTLGLLAVIAVTGIWQTMENPFVKVDSYSTLERLRDTTTYGKALFVKHVFVFATVGLSLATRFYLARPRGSGNGPVLVAAGGPPQPATGVAGTPALRLLTLAAALNLADCLAVLLATGRMTIELH